MVIRHDQRRLHMPEPWSYALAAQNFAQGNWTLTNDDLAAARTQVRLEGARLTQYVEIEPGTWAFRQSPGFPLQLAPFTAVGLPRLANVVLAVLAVLVLYPVLAAWYSERLAFLGVTLLLWTPMSLLALHYTNMDTFAGGIWPLIAGALLLGYERLDRERGIRNPLTVNRKQSTEIAQPQNQQKSEHGTRNRANRGIQIGGLLALGIMLTYNWLSFGSPFDNGRFPPPARILNNYK